MLNAEEINAAIAELEYKESSYPNYAKLANLYVIRDGMRQGKQQSYRQAESPEQIYQRAASSDFLRVAWSKNTEDVFGIIDDLMDTLRAVNEKVYFRVMENLRKL